MLSALLVFLIPALFLAFGCIAVDNITEEDDCTPNPGGIVKLHLIRKSEVTAIPDPGVDGVTISTDITLKALSAFATFELPLDKSELSHKTVGDPGSQSVEQELEIFIPRGTPGVDAVLSTMINGKFILVAVDAKGQQRVVGSLLRPATMTHDYKSGKKNTDANGTTIKFTGGGSIPYYYTGALPLKA